MIYLSDLLRSNTVYLDVHCSNRVDVLHWIAHYFAPIVNLKSEAIYKCLHEREALGSTALGQGVAIPHGRLRGLASPHVVFLKTAQPIEFDAPDNLEVNQFFVLLVPEKATDDHLEILSQIAQLFTSPDLRTLLAKSHDVAEVFEQFHSHLLTLSPTRYH